ATWQTIEIWHHGLIFAGWRARAELWENKLGELLTCPFCLSPWIACLMLILWHVPYAGWLVLTLAIARTANLGNDLSHHWCRTPKTTMKVP
ncbi:MAG: DUF1360 domain-containing protein, partial [Acidobacteria bacterium]|nr:DUF1360 domain-containing protein [Acidobacteriota bacterium]